MRIRQSRTWCADCTAPEVFPENAGLLMLFLDALPAWREPGGLGEGGLMGGFQRAEVLALCDLHGIAPAARAETWEAIRDLEAELRRILAAQRSQSQPEPNLRPRRHGQ